MSNSIAETRISRGFTEVYIRERRITAIVRPEKSGVQRSDNVSYRGTA